jgi:hypothetical protein
MINRETAIELAQKWFKNATSLGPHISSAAVDEKNVIETSFAWILPWDDHRRLAGDIRYGIDGHSPVVVLKSDGTAMWLPALTASERARWKSKELRGTIDHRIANLAENLGVKNA